MHLQTLMLLWGTVLGPAGCPPPVPVVVITADKSPQRPEGHPKEWIFLHPESGHLMVVAPYYEAPIPQPCEIWSLVELARFTAPSVRTVIIPAEGSARLRYEYSFSNGPEARQKARTWRFQDLDFDLADMKAPEGWAATRPPALWRTHPSAPPMERRPIEARSAGFWPAGMAIEGLAPGQTQAGFSILSALRPGPVLVWVNGYTTKGGLSFETSDEVINGLALLLGSCYNYQRTLAFAPRYDTTADARTIAQDFASALQFQIANAIFRQEDPFTSEAASVLGRLPSPADLSRLRSLAKSPAQIDFTSALSAALARGENLR